MSLSLLYSRRFHGCHGSFNINETLHLAGGFVLLAILLKPSQVPEDELGCGRSCIDCDRLLLAQLVMMLIVHRWLFKSRRGRLR